MNIANIKYFCTVNGDGIGVSFFVTGCSRHCPGCIAKTSWDKNSGHEYTPELKQKVINKLAPEYINHLSILGGEPFELFNVKEVADLVKTVREKYGDSKKIWLWTGYIMKDIGNHIAEIEEHDETYDDVLKKSGCKFDYIPENEYSDYIIKNVDYIIDGPFVQELHKFGLHYKGSSNQRLIHMKEYSK